MGRFPNPARRTVFSSVQVEIKTTLVLKADPGRVNVLLINDSDTVMYLMLGADAVVGEGIRLNAEGGSYEISVIAGTIDDRVINACHVGKGRKKILIVERNNR